MAAQKMYRYYAELYGYEPAIWRRFEVPRNINMARLAYIIMTLFEMQASHLFMFEVNLNENYRRHLISKGYTKKEAKKTFPDDKIVRIEVQHEDLTIQYNDFISLFDNDLPENHPDSAEYIPMHNIISNPGDRLEFLYDFGDDWCVLLVLEDILEYPDVPGKEFPRVLEGKGYGIVEDCGGIGGLYELAEAFKDPDNPEYEDLLEWLGRSDLDLTAFDVEDMNFRLKKVPRIYGDLYEYDLSPTQASMNILTRKYKK